MSFSKITIPVTTANNSLLIEVDPTGQLWNTYYGPKLAQLEDYKQISPLHNFVPGNDDLLNQRLAYVAAGSCNLLEPALAVTHNDQNNSLVLIYEAHTIQQLDSNRTLLRIALKDPRYAFHVDLYYQSHYAEDVIEQWAEIKHQEPGTVYLHKYASANLTLCADSFTLKSQHGGWGREMQPQTQILQEGLYTIDSKLGTRTNLLHSSSFMLFLNEGASETNGEVIAGSLAWSGNFRLDFECFDEYYLRITAGINPHQSTYALPIGETFITPRFVYTYSDQGAGRASQNLHLWAKNYQVLHGNGERLTLLNNWETTYFDFDEDKLVGLIQDSQSLGVDLFLLDDGWFGNKYPRNAANAGLGDWKINLQKLPGGLDRILEEADKHAVAFGIWLEPEMVNPRSELYEQHPEWVVRQPGLDEYHMRNQLVLDLSNLAVQDFIYHTIDNLLTRYPSLAFIKWDCNSLIYNPHSATSTPQNHFYINYTRGLYDCLARIRAKYPAIHMMLCAGGGSRVDYAALKYFTEFWPSDNTDAYDRIFIQWEYLNYFPAICLANHVTDMGSQSLKFKMDVAFMGKLGFDLPVHSLSPTDLQFARSAVIQYQAIRDLIWHGLLYKLQAPYGNKVASLCFVAESRDKGLVLSYYMPTTFQTSIAKPIKMQGLDPGKSYTIREINLYPGQISPIDEQQSFTGDFLHTIGFNPQVSRQRRSVVLLVEVVK